MQSGPQYKATHLSLPLGQMHCQIQARYTLLLSITSSHAICILSTMNLLLFLTFIVGVVAATDVQGRPNRNLRAPVAVASEYTTATGHPTVEFGTANLKQIPSNAIDADSKDAALPVLAKRWVLRQLRGLTERQSTTNDFYECRDSTPLPATTDCDTVVSSVLAVDQALIVAANACLTFQFGTCWGFFCALCDQLSTDTDFIGAQLGTAHALCLVANNQVGTIVGADAPQWEAGFVYQGDGLPDYHDVC
ncbi:hypothetical protein F5B20DRAFT_292445 [Whalleya microplaca]|nr:hypothetical protein F5B20DRAFT_292445 [Whalleya microplaca]